MVSKIRVLTFVIEQKHVTQQRVSGYKANRTAKLQSMQRCSCFRNYSLGQMSKPAARSNGNRSLCYARSVSFQCAFARISSFAPINQYDLVLTAINFLQQSLHDEANPLCTAKDMESCQLVPSTSCRGVRCALLTRASMNKLQLHSRALCHTSRRFERNPNPLDQDGCNL
jgi:hypothetical protein